MIHLPGHAPLATTLSSQQLTESFPNLHKYILPSTPGVAVLPKGSVTYHGLETVLRWTEYRLSHPDINYELDLIKSVEMYHAMNFLGRKSTDFQMRYIYNVIRAAILEGIELQDAKALWKLRKYAGAAPFIRCLAQYIALLQHLDKNLSVRDSSLPLTEIEAFKTAKDVIKWAESKEELWNRIQTLHTFSARQKSNLRNLRKYGYVKRKGEGVQWIAKSAVQCAKMKTGLETIEEDEGQ